MENKLKDVGTVLLVVGFVVVLGRLMYELSVMGY